MGVERGYAATGPSEEHTLSPLLNKTTSDVKASPLSDDNSVIIKDFEQKGAKDRFLIVYCILILFGLAVLLPWNIFITATGYFVDHKLNTNTSFNSAYRNDFTFYVGIIGQSTNVIMNLFNILISLGGNPKNRIPYTIILSSVVIVFHIVMAIINSYDWPLTFFIITCVSVFVMYIATGIMNSCVFYVSSIFPMVYINAIVLGNNFAGIFTSVANIISKLASPDLRIAAIYYFISAFVVLMMAFIGYFLMQRTNFFRYHYELAEQKKKENLLNTTQTKSKVPYLKIIRKIWLMLFCIWLNFFSTLAIFPVYQLGIVRSSSSFIIGQHWFHDIITFLTFNILVTIGNLLPNLIRVPGPKYIAIPVILRAVIVFVFFTFCNFKPDKRNLVPILITNDYVYWAACCISPLLFGYFTSLLMMYTPKKVDPEHAGSASMIAALTIAIGVMTGLQFTKVFEKLVLI